MDISNKLTKHVVLNTTDPFEARHALEKLICPHHLRLKNSASDLHVNYSDFNLGSVHLGYLKYGTPVFIDIDNLTNSYIVKIPVCGQSSTRLGRNDFAKTDRSTGAILSPGQIFNMRHHQDYEEILVTINSAFLESQFYNLTGISSPNRVEFDLQFNLAEGVGLAMRELVLFLVSQADQPHSNVSTDAVRRQYEEMFTTMILTGFNHNNIDILKNSEYTLQPRAIRDVTEYIEENYVKPITMSELSDYAGVNIRSLQSGFKNSLNMSPTHYLKNVRLTKLREKLLNSSTDDSVTDLIMQSGFSHLGRCAIEYKKRFGESPSETLKTHRHALKVQLTAGR